jgi:hypothetical protein
MTVTEMAREPRALEPDALESHALEPHALDAVADAITPKIARAPRVGTLAILTGLAWVFWLASLPFIDVNRMTDVGLVSVLGPLNFIALITLTIAFGWTVTFHHTSTRLLVAQVGSLVAMLSGITALVEREPSYFSAYLHVGFIEYIARTGSTLPTLDARFSWPGSFSFGALLTQLAGVDSALHFIRWAPLVFDLLWLLPLWVIVSSITTNPRVRWLTVWIFPVANWVHQDYFSPQALNYFLYLVVLAVLLRWFRPRIVALVEEKPHRRPKVPIRRVLRADGICEDRVTPPFLDSAQRCGLFVILVLVYFASVMSHQLTPVVLLLSVATLAFFRRTTLTTLPVIMGVVMLAWVSFGAETFWIGHLRSLFGGAGAVSSNIAAGIGRTTTGGEGRTFVLGLRVAFTLGVLGLAAVGVVRRWRSGSRQLTCALLAAVPFTLIVGQSYGGEMLMRAFLFALPFVAVLGAMAFFPKVVSGGTTRMALTITVVAVLMTGGFLISRYGNERFEMVPSGELAAMRWIYAHAPAGSKLAAPSRNLPWRYQDIERYQYSPIADGILASPRAVLKFIDKRPGDSYFIPSQSQQLFGRELYGLPPHWLEKLEGSLVKTGRLRLVYSNPDTRVYKVIAAPDAPPESEGAPVTAAPATAAPQGAIP